MCHRRSLKATAIDSKLRVVHAETVNFDATFPHYGTSGGVHRNGLRATAPPAMWIEAFDNILSRLQASECQHFGRHGTIIDIWNRLLKQAEDFPSHCLPQSLSFVAAGSLLPV